MTGGGLIKQSSWYAIEWTYNGNLPTGYPLPDEHDFDAKQLSEYFDNYQLMLGIPQVEVRG